jgi:cytochrome b6-f complex iron-sulfur subunit
VPEPTLAPIDEPRLSRRAFLTYLLGFAGALGLAGLLAPIIRYAYPVAKTQVSLKQKVGDVSTLTPGGDALYFDYEESPAALILLKDGTPKAFYLACTHFGCITKWQVDEQIFFCPCHNGAFGPDGAVKAGPPPKPLVQLKVVPDGTTLYVEGTV